MYLHLCKSMCWHLSGKSLSKILFSIQGVAELRVAWDFVKEMKSNPVIDEIVWTRHKIDGEVFDETLHLIRKNGEWIKNDIINWNKTKNKV